MTILLPYSPTATMVPTAATPNLRQEVQRPNTPSANLRYPLGAPPENTATASCLEPTVLFATCSIQVDDRKIATRNSTDSAVKEIGSNTLARYVKQVMNTMNLGQHDLSVLQKFHSSLHNTYKNCPNYLFASILFSCPCFCMPKHLKSLSCFQVLFAANTFFASRTCLNYLQSYFQSQDI